MEIERGEKRANRKTRRKLSRSCACEPRRVEDLHRCKRQFRAARAIRFRNPFPENPESSPAACENTITTTSPSAINLGTKNPPGGERDRRGGVRKWAKTSSAGARWLWESLKNTATAHRYENWIPPAVAGSARNPRPAGLCGGGWPGGGCQLWRQLQREQWGKGVSH